VKCEGFVVLPPSAAMEVSGGKCVDVAKVISVVREICEFLDRLGDFVDGFSRGFQRGYQDYC